MQTQKSVQCCVTGVPVAASYQLFRGAAVTHPLTQWAMSLTAYDIKAEAARLHVDAAATASVLTIAETKLRLLNLAWLHCHKLMADVWKPQPLESLTSEALNLEFSCLRELTTIPPIRLLDCPHISFFNSTVASRLYFAVDGSLTAKAHGVLSNMLCLVSDLQALAVKYADHLPVLVRALVEAGMQEHPALLVGKLWMLEKALAESDDPDSHYMLKCDITTLIFSDASGGLSLKDVILTFVNAGGASHSSLARSYSGKVIRHLAGVVSGWTVTHRPQSTSDTTLASQVVQASAPEPALNIPKLKAKLKSY